MRELEQANGNAALNEAELCRLRAERTTLRCLHAITIPFPFSEPNVRTLDSVALESRRCECHCVDCRHELDQLRITSAQAAARSSDLEQRVRLLEAARFVAESALFARDKVCS